MKAVTIPQPWASLLFTGPRVETFKWSTDYRGPLAIHASPRGFDGHSKFRHEFMVRAAAAWRIGVEDVLRQIDKLPLGCVIGELELTDCRLIIESGYRHGGRAMVVLEGDGRARIFDGLDASLGDFAPGRYVWFTEPRELYQTPYPQTGRPRLWSWERRA